MNTQTQHNYCRVSRGLLLFIRFLIIAFFAFLLMALLHGCAGTQWNIQREITPGVTVGVSGDGKEVRNISIR